MISFADPLEAHLKQALPWVPLSKQACCEIEKQEATIVESMALNPLGNVY